MHERECIREVQQAIRSLKVPFCPTGELEGRNQGVVTAAQWRGGSVACGVVRLCRDDDGRRSPSSSIDRNRWWRDETRRERNSNVSRQMFCLSANVGIRPSLTRLGDVFRFVWYLVANLQTRSSHARNGLFYSVSILVSLCLPLSLCLRACVLTLWCISGPAADQCAEPSSIIATKYRSLM